MTELDAGPTVLEVAALLMIAVKAGRGDARLWIDRPTAPDEDATLYEGEDIEVVSLPYN